MDQKDAMKPKDAASGSFGWFNRDQKEQEAMTTSPRATSGEQPLYCDIELSKNSWLLAIQFPARFRTGIIRACIRSGAATPAA